MRNSGVVSSSIKLVLVGPSNAGKTSIAKKFTTDTFDEFQDMTVGSAFFSKQVLSQRHNVSVRVEVWDTAGQEKYRSMAPMYFRNAAGAMLVYDQTVKESFAECESVWLPDVLPFLRNSTQFVVVCGNKADLVHKDDPSAGQFMSEVTAACNGRGLALFQTSAKSGLNVAKAFEHLVDVILDDRAKQPAHDVIPPSFTAPVTLEEDQNKTRKFRPDCCKK